MKVKICGLRVPENIKMVDALNPDFLGFIFYNKSKRAVNEQTLDFLKAFKTNSKKVGVFVNADLTEVINQVNTFSLDYAQLHGNESVEEVKTLADLGVKITKAFAINPTFNWEKLNEYQPYVSYFLFDTPTVQYGGSGKKFEWSLLEKYTGAIPYFLSGGITPDDASQLKALSHERLTAIDINSRFEIEPGIKDIQSIKRFLKKLNHD